MAQFQLSLSFEFTHVVKICVAGKPFDLQPSSPALTNLGFEPIDTSKVGPRPARVGAPARLCAPTGLGADQHVQSLVEAGLLLT